MGRWWSGTGTGRNRVSVRAWEILKNLKFLVLKFPYHPVLYPLTHPLQPSNRARAAVIIITWAVQTKATLTSALTYVSLSYDLAIDCRLERERREGSERRRLVEWEGD